MFFDQIPKKHFFFGILRNSKKKPRVFQNSKIFKTMLISPNIFGILENSMFYGNFSCGRMAVYLIENILEAVCSNGFLTQRAVATLRMANKRK